MHSASMKMNQKWFVSRAGEFTELPRPIAVWIWGRGVKKWS